VRARGTDFSNSRTDVAGIGTVVTATDLEANQAEVFTVLGAWDFDAEKGIISYLTPVGQSLMNRKVGEVVEFELHGARHRHRIDRIEPYRAPIPAVVNQPAVTVNA
jgi:transcription elongation GreA/GreB family factor